MQFKAIIFDFDGVLFDSEKIHLHACNQVFLPLGFTIPEKVYFERYVGLADKEMFELILEDQQVCYPQDKVVELRQNKISAYKEYITNLPSLDGVQGVKGFLYRFKSAFEHFAICSSATRDEIETTLEKLESGCLRAYFKEIIAIDDVKCGKPSPEGYLLTAARLNVQPQACLVVEDSPVGVMAAKSAGMTVFGITTSHTEAELKKADHVVKNYDEIDLLLKKNRISCRE